MVTIPDGAYSLEQIEAAVNRVALADATFRAAVEKEMAPTLLADSDVDGAWAGLGTHSADDGPGGAFPGALPRWRHLARRVRVLHGNQPHFLRGLHANIRGSPSTYTLPLARL